MSRRIAIGRRALVGLIGLWGLTGCIDVPERDDPESDADLRPTDATPTGVDFDPLPRDAGRDQTVYMRDRGLPLDQGPSPRDTGLSPRDRGVSTDGPLPDMPSGPCPYGGELTDGLPVCLRVEPCTALPAPRAEHGAVLVDTSTVLVAGGTRGALDGNDLDRQTWLYDGETDSWMDVGRFTSDGKGVYGQTLTALPDGRALLAGGQQGTSIRDETYLFDPGMPLNGGGDDRGQWRNDDDTDSRSLHAAVWDAQRGEVFASGGKWTQNPNHDSQLREGEGWIPPRVDDANNDGVWNDRNDPSPRLFGHHLVRWTDDSLVRFGGYSIPNNNPLPNLQATRRVGDAWQVIPGNAKLIDGAVVPTPAAILLVGGAEPGAPDTSLRRIELAALLVQVLPDMQVARREMAAARVGSASMAVIVGGQETRGDRLILEVVDVADGQQGRLDVDLGWQGLWTGARGVQLTDGDAIFIGGRVGGVPTDRCLRVGIVE